MHEAIRCFFQDVARLPVITRRAQEVWLGIQLRAPERLQSLVQEDRSDTRDADGNEGLLSVYASLASCHDKMETACREAQQLPPKLNTWAAELVSARRRIAELHHSRLRRFVRRLEQTPANPAKDGLIALSYEIAELLSLLPDGLLSRIAEAEGLPLLEEVSLWLERSDSRSKSLAQLAEYRARQARNTLVTGYVRYVLRLARNHVDQGLDYADLVQEGFLGLMRGADRFDYRTGARFATYATSWIWQGIGRSIADQSRTIRLPVHVQESIGRIRRVYDQLKEETGTPPTLEALAVHAGLLTEEDENAILACRRCGTRLPKELRSRYRKSHT